MPKIVFKGEKIICNPGDNLRKILLKHKISPYNGFSRFLNCHGLGSCGTCAVMVKGIINNKTFMEKWRLNFPPHKEEQGLRLACQVSVWGDVIIKKGDGFWGQNLAVPVRSGEHKNIEKDQQ